MSDGWDALSKISIVPLLVSIAPPHREEHIHGKHPWAMDFPIDNFLWKLFQQDRL